jgi:hypothetical protein
MILRAVGVKSINWGRQTAENVRSVTESVDEFG